MEYRFNPAPGWPAPPEGWVPPEGWQPDPAWPPAPEGWQFWLPKGTEADASKARSTAPQQEAPSSPAAGSIDNAPSQATDAPAQQVKYRFNPAPGWPAPPEGWVPPEGWQPDPAWPPAPEGWQFWLPEEQEEAPLEAEPESQGSKSQDLEEDHTLQGEEAEQSSDEGADVPAEPNQAEEDHAAAREDPLGENQPSEYDLGGAEASSPQEQDATPASPAQWGVAGHESAPSASAPAQQQQQWDSQAPQQTPPPPVGEHHRQAHLPPPQQHARQTPPAPGRPAQASPAQKKGAGLLIALIVIAALLAIGFVVSLLMYTASASTAAGVEATGAIDLLILRIL